MDCTNFNSLTKCKMMEMQIFLRQIQNKFYHITKTLNRTTSMVSTILNQWSIALVLDIYHTFILLARSGVKHVTYPTHMKNNLWFHYMKPTNTPIKDVPHIMSVVRV